MKRLFILLALILLAVPAVAGFKEKRALKEFQDKVYPDLKKQLDTAAGFDVAMEVDWNSISEEDYETSYTQAFTKVYFLPIINAFKEICGDGIGKSTLKIALKKVAIRNSSHRYYPDKFSFKDGILTIDHSPIANISNPTEITARIKMLLEQGL